MGQDALDFGDGREMIATYGDAEQLARAVAVLAASGVALEHLSVTSTRLLLLRDRRRSLAGRLLEAGLGGFAFGAVLALLFGFLDLTDPIASAAVVAGWGALTGAVTGALAAAVARWLRDGDPAGAPGFDAARHVLFAESAWANDARRVVGATPVGNGLGLTRDGA